MPREKPVIGREYDKAVWEILQMGPATKNKVARTLQIPVHTARAVLRRMKSQGKIYWRQETEPAQMKEDYQATKDPNPFPKPWWWTPDVGFFG